MQIQPDQREVLHKREIFNIGAALKRGERITAAERRLLDESTAGVEPTENAGNFVETWDELATALGVDRRTLTNFRTRHAKRIKEEGRELTRADNRHNVAAWRQLADEFGELKGKGSNNPEIDYVDERQLRLRRETFQLKKAEWEFEKAKDLMLPIAEFEAALGVTVGAFTSRLDQLPGRATGKIVSRNKAAVLSLLKEVLTEKQFEKAETKLEQAAADYADIERILQNEIDVAKRELGGCDYLKATG